MHSKPVSKAKSKKKHKTDNKSINQSQNLTDILNEEVITVANRQQPIPSQASSSSNNRAASTTSNSETFNQLPSQNDLQDAVNIVSKSDVWKYAKKLTNDKAKCNNCNKEISCKDHSTSGLRRHLNSCIHGVKFISSTKNTTKITISNDMKKKLHELVYQCIIRDGRSFGDLRKPGMARLLEEIAPGM